MGRILKCAFALALFVDTTSSLMAANVKTDYNHSADFSQIHTYCWGQVTTADPLYVQRIKDQVNKDLQAKGWSLVPTGGDVSVFAKGSVHNEQELETYYNGLGGGWGGRWGWGRWGGAGFGESITTTNVQPVGMLVIDMFQGSSKELVWRGASEEDLSNSSEKNTKHLNQNIDRMLKKFPPKK